MQQGCRRHTVWGREESCMVWYGVWDLWCMWYMHCIIVQICCWNIQEVQAQVHQLLSYACSKVCWEELCVLFSPHPPTLLAVHGWDWNCVLFAKRTLSPEGVVHVKYIRCTCVWDPRALLKVLTCDWMTVGTCNWHYTSWHISVFLLWLVGSMELLCLLVTTCMDVIYLASTFLAALA